MLARVTYQIFEQYWQAAATNPASTDFDRKFANFVENAQKIVISRTLDTARWKNTRLIKDNIAEEVLKLKRQPAKKIVVPERA